MLCSVLLTLKEEPKIRTFESQSQAHRALGLGDQVCVDTCSSMAQGRVLVSSSNQALFLIPRRMLRTRDLALSGEWGRHAYIRGGGRQNIFRKSEQGSRADREF
jgi:hypothetical protein